MFIAIWYTYYKYNLFLGDKVMSVFKRLFCLILLFLLLFAFSACSEKEQPNDKDNTEPKPQTITVEKEEIKIESVSLSETAAATTLAKQDFAGAEIAYYTTKEPSTLQKSKLAAFSKAHNCTIKIVFEPNGSIEGIATSIASGKPYDIIENDINTFSKTLFYDIYESLQTSIDPIDFYSAERPQDFGISNAFASRFTIKDQLLAVGSAESVDFYVLYYNRLLFEKSDLKGPQTLWETGRWSSEEFLKFGTVTSLLSAQTFLQLPSFSDWLNIKCIDVLKFQEEKFTNAVTEENAILAAKDYQNLVFGDLPLSIPKSGANSFKNGNAYSVIDKASNYSYWRDIANNSPAFKKSLDNLGCVVLPSDFSATTAQPAASVRCYSALKGAKNPTAAPCFALFESRSFNRTKSNDKLPDNITEYLTTSFNANGFIPYFNFTINETGYSIYKMFDEYGMSIRDGGRGEAAMKSAAPRINQLIETSSKVELPTIDQDKKK